MGEGDVGVPAPRIRPLSPVAPVGRAGTGDRAGQAAGARAFRGLGRWTCAGRGCVAVAVSAAAAWWVLAEPARPVAPAVLVLACGAGLFCRMRARSARARLRWADESVGFPVPRDLAGALGTACEPLPALHGWYALPDDRLDPSARQVLRDHEHDVRDVTGRVFDDLHRAREAWAAGDAGTWRECVERAVGSARGAHTVYADVRSVASLPAPELPWHATWPTLDRVACTDDIECPGRHGRSTRGRSRNGR